MARSGRELSLAVSLTLVSGGLMTWAGFVLGTGRVTTALWIMLPPAVTIEAALALLRQADRARGRRSPSWSARLRQEGVILLSGGVMMLAGYAAAAVSWFLALPLVVLGGFVAGAALVAGDTDRKRRLVRGSERWLVNPPTRAALGLGVPMPLVLLETTGRRSGRRRRTPVMNGIVGRELWIVAEHGLRAGYVRNLIAEPRVRVKRGRRWTEGTAEVLAQDDPLARTTWIADRLGRGKWLGLVATKLFCVEPVTVRVDLS